MATNYRFEIAISFAGDNKRDHVRQIAEILRDRLGDGKVFFDEWFEAEIAGQDADIVLQNIYKETTRLVVTCVCERYNEKPWTQDEWRAIRSFERKLRDAGSENLMRMRFLPLRFGDGDLDGLFDNAIVPDVRNRSSENVAKLILDRLKLAKSAESGSTSHNKFDHDFYVSFTGEDREVILPIVDLIRKLGVSVWIDPNKIADEIDYTQEVPRAISTSRCVLLFASENSFRSRSVEKELGLARKRGKTVLPLRIEDIETPKDFENNHTLAQHIDVFGDLESDWLNELSVALPGLGIDIDSVNSRANTSQRPTLKFDSVGEFACSPLLPYLVDRAQQEQDLREAMTRHLREVSRRPLVVIIYGSLEQSVNEYLGRLETISLPHALKRFELPDTVAWYDIPWLRARDWERNSKRAIRTLRGEIEDRLELRPEQWPDSLIQHMRFERATSVFCHRIRWQDWTTEHVATVHAWIRDWGELNSSLIAYPVLVVVAIEYAPIHRGVLDRFVRRKSANWHPIHQHVTNLADHSADNLGICIIPELSNVTMEDVENWILNVIKPTDAAGMIRRARIILEDPRLLDREGVPMEMIATKLREFLFQADELKEVLS